MDELKETVETLIDLDEPEAMLATIRDAATRRKGERWRVVAQALTEALATVTAALNPPPRADVEGEAKASTK
jgi:hypothetical protein